MGVRTHDDSIEWSEDQTPGDVELRRDDNGIYWACNHSAGAVHLSLHMATGERFDQYLASGTWTQLVDR